MYDRNTYNVSKKFFLKIMGVLSSHIKIKLLLRHVMYCMQCLRFEKTRKKNQRKCYKQKINVLLVKYHSWRRHFFLLIK